MSACDPVETLARRHRASRPMVALVDETRCIGCTLCIPACEFDAIVGARKRMHAVLSDLCSGCELCLPACPVDCIAMVPATRAWTAEDLDCARLRRAKRSALLTPESPGVIDARARSAAIAAAFARARARRLAWPGPR